MSLSWWSEQYLSGLLHWHWGNHTIAPVLVKQPWRILVGNCFRLYRIKPKLIHMHGWVTQSTWAAHSRAAHHRAAHNPAARWCAAGLSPELHTTLQHTTELRHRVGVARSCAARLCVSRLGSAEGHPWHVNTRTNNTTTTKQKIPKSVSVRILGRELGPSGVSPNQNSRWKLAFSPLKHV